MSAGAGTSQTSGDSYGYTLSDVAGGSSSSIFGPQADAMSGLFGMASGMTSKSRVGQDARAGRQSAAQLGQAGQGFLGTLQGLSDPSSMIAAEEQSLSQGLGNLYREELLPGIEGDAIAAGGFGGGRQGVAQGVAAGQIGDAYAEALGGINARGGAQAQAAAGMGLSALPGLFDLGMAGRMSRYAPLAQLSGLLGNPAILSESWNRAATRSENQSRRSGSSMQANFGI